MNTHMLLKRLLLLAFLITFMAAPAPGFTQTATDDPPQTEEDGELKGRIELLPASGLVGTWRVAGREFQVTEATVLLGFGERRPAVGRCVEVKLTTAAPPVALRITPDDDCAVIGQPGLPQEWKGKVEERPTGESPVGLWKIGGRSFSVTAATYFKEFSGPPPPVGACVEVTFLVEGERSLALKVEPEDDCAATGTPPGEVHSFRGRVDERPATGRFGAWVIAGRSFTAVEAASSSEGTRFEGFGPDLLKPAKGDCVVGRYREQNATRTLLIVAPGYCEGIPPPPSESKPVLEAHGLLSAREGTNWTIGGVIYDVSSARQRPETGPLDVGVCVKVEYTASETTRKALSLTSRPAFRCAPSAQEHEIYGVIKELPADGPVGTWTLEGGIKVVVTRETKLEDGPFAAGRLVKITIVRDGDGTLVAVKVEAKTPRRDEESRRFQERGKAYGKIEGLPTTANLAGEWVVGGATYVVGEQTRLRDRGTPFSGGACVEISFSGVAEGKRLAVKVERVAPDKCAEGVTEVARAFGFVEALPATGYLGAWTIGGVSYEVLATTGFSFEAGVGAPVKGSFVEVRYSVVDGKKVARKIHTRVPPGLGDETRVERLNSFSPTSILAAEGTLWTIGGVQYIVTDATLVVEGVSNLEVGARVMINAYRGPTGELVATQVATVSEVYLPLTIR